MTQLFNNAKNNRHHRKSPTLVVVLLLVLLCIVLMSAAGSADAAAGAGGGPPRRMSLKRRQALAKAKAAQAALDEHHYELRYKEYQKALPSPDDAQKMVPYTGGGVSSEEVDSHIRSLSVGKLRSYLKEREATCPGCVEKLHLIERAMQVRGWETEGERVGKELTPLQFSAENALSFHHTMASGSTAAPLTDASGNQLIPTTQSREQLAAVQLSHGIQCSEALSNGTQYCHKVPADDAPPQYM